MEEFFSFDGRVRRMTFWVNAVACGVVTFLLNLTMVEQRFDWERGFYTHISAWPIYYLVTIVVMARVYSIAARRFQDAGMERTWIWLLIPISIVQLIPSLANTGFGAFLSLIGVACAYVASGFLGFHPGDDEENAFGPVPEQGQMY